MASGYEMRVGDAEREATAAELREHYASGRLTLEELNERIDKAFAAKTRGDLDGLMRDLPSARPRTGGQAGVGAGTAWTGAGGPGSGWTGGPGTGWTGQGSGWGAGAGRQAGQAIGAILTTCLLVCALFIVGGLGIFGIGTGRPFGVVLIVLALGLLRRLIFGRRFGGRGRGCGRGPARRRWK